MKPNHERAAVLRASLIRPQTCILAMSQAAQFSGPVQNVPERATKAAIAAENAAEQAAADATNSLQGTWASVREAITPASVAKSVRKVALQARRETTNTVRHPKDAKLAGDERPLHLSGPLMMASSVAEALSLTELHHTDRQTADRLRSYQFTAHNMAWAQAWPARSRDVPSFSRECRNRFTALVHQARLCNVCLALPQAPHPHPPALSCPSGCWWTARSLTRSVLAARGCTC